MRVPLHLLAAALVLAVVGKAAAAINATTYPFSTVSNGVLADMSSGTTQLLGPGLNDDTSAVVPIGFDYWFDGVRYAQFVVNANGFLRLDAVVNINPALNNIDSTSQFQKIAPYWDDLCTGSTGQVHYKVVGNAPFRKLVVEWQNMLITRGGAACTSVGNGTFQLWLTERSGVIEFVYGAIQPPAAADGGYSIGIQAGAATNFASVSSATNSVSHVSSDDAQMNAITAGRAYIFTPVAPVIPSNMTFTNVTPTTVIVNWTDNSNNEIGFGIYKSTDNVNFTFVRQTNANDTSEQVIDLDPSTTYYFRVAAVTDGARSAFLNGNTNTTATATPIISTATGGDWNNPVTWVGGVVPSDIHAVTIADGATVEINVDATVHTLIVGQGGGTTATLRFEPNTARIFDVVASTTIASSGRLITGANGTVNTHVFRLRENLTNNGVLNLSTNAGAAGATISFIGPKDSSFGGTGATTDIQTIRLFKDTGEALVTLNPTTLRVQGLTGDVAGFASFTRGTLKISGTFAMTNRVFASANYFIQTGHGFWLDNPNFVVAAQNGTVDFAGSIRVSQGTYNIGTTAADGVDPGNNSPFFTLEGGTVNISGRFSSNPIARVTYTQTGGTMNVATVGNTPVIGEASFYVNSTGSFTMSGGVINPIQAATGAYANDFRVVAPTNITGGVLVIGSAATTANSNFYIDWSMPSVVIDNTTNPKTVKIGIADVSGSVLVRPGSTLNLNNGALHLTGNLTNNGILEGGPTGPGGQIYFNGSTPQTYIGSGVVPYRITEILFDNPAGVTFNSAAAQIVVTRLTLINGNVTNSNKLTLGDGAVSTLVTIGSATVPSSPGSFDVAPTFNLGTGTQELKYLPGAGSRATGNEVNPSRMFVRLTLDNPGNTLTLAGGDLTLLDGGGTALTLTNGTIHTGANTVILNASNAVVARTNGYVDGNLRKAYSTPTTKTFEIGDATTYLPVSCQVNSGILPNTVTISTTPAQEPHYPGVLSALRRYWTINTANTLNGGVTFQYLLTDVIGVENAYRTIRHNGTFADVGAVNTLQHLALVSNTALGGSYTAVEQDNDFDGMPNSYENAHGLNQNSAADANTDLDGDGTSNFAEYLAGTDPQLATSLLRVTSVNRAPSTYTVHFDAIAMKRYRLEYKSALTGPDWLMLPMADFVSPTTANQQIIDTTANGTNASIACE